MSLINLTEDFLYDRLPEGLIQLDERGLIQAVLGGFQDRIEDLRFYAKRFQSFYTPIPEALYRPNVVLVTYRTDQGRDITRSIDLETETPQDGTSDLLVWAATQLNVDTDRVSNARYGVDPLRDIEPSLLDYLATNVGAVLYASAILKESPSVTTSTGTLTAANYAYSKLLETYFPRLKFKGTAKSFEALGKLLGWDDVRVTPLWGRVSPRLPNDPGSDVNDPDFSEMPEFWPQQTIGPFYDPLDQADGPFYDWTGTASAGTASTKFYSQVVNGFQPYVEVLVTGTASGTVIQHPSSGSYVLADGAPHQKAMVDAGDIQFRALGEGESYNGVTVTVFDVVDADLRGVNVDGRLSSIKYRTSFYNLGLTITSEKAQAVFGTLTAKANKDLAVAPHEYQSFVGNLTAVSPYRPFTSGTVALDTLTTDWLTPFTGTISTYTERREAGLGDRQENWDDLSRAGAQATQALEEVRAATRRPRVSSFGYLQKDQVGYAPYPAQDCLFTLYGSIVAGTYHGTFSTYPLPPYYADVGYVSGGFVTVFDAGTNPAFPGIVTYQNCADGGTIAGTIGYTGTGTNSYLFTATGTWPQWGTVCALFTVTDTEVVRPEPFSWSTGTTVLAALADYGLAGTNHDEVAALINSWSPQAVVAMGDNNYPDGQAATIAANNVGYESYIVSDRFFPAIGNHDYCCSSTGTDLTPHLTYFFDGTAPGEGGRYYSRRIGNVEIFCLNAGWNSSQAAAAVGDPYYVTTQEPSGNSLTSTQALWLKQALQESTATWKIVYSHYPPYASETTTNNYAPGYPRLRWPFKAWGADLYLAGHVHAYERLEVDGLTYITCGVGGAGNRVFDGYVSPGSVVRYAPLGATTEHGALRIFATGQGLQIDFILDTGQVIDRVFLDATKKYLARPEDEIDDDEVYGTADMYPWRRDIVGNGELVEQDYYTAGTNNLAVSILEKTMTVPDQTGAEYDVYAIKGQEPYRLVAALRATSPASDYVPGQPSVAFSGTFRDQAGLGADDLNPYVNPHDPDNFRTQFSRIDYDTVFNPGWAIYNAGLVQGVLVADPDKFGGAYHTENLVGWLPFNEHPLDDLTVTDHARTLAVSQFLNAAPEDRVWDDTFGWVLYMRPGATLQVFADREMTTEGLMTFWINVDSTTTGPTQEIIFEFGPMRWTLDAGANQITSWGNVPGVGWTVSSNYPVTPGQWHLFGMGFTTTADVFLDGDLSSFNYSALGGGGLVATTDDTVLSLSGKSRRYKIHDLRIWTEVKTYGQMELVHNYQPRPTQTLYSLGHILAANDGDRFGLKVLPRGWLVPAQLPAWVRTPKYARVERYDGGGEYQGEARFKEVGLGGGQMPPYNWQLGTQGPTLTGAGTVVVSTQIGAYPGTNAYWGKDSIPGTYIELSGSTASGSIAVVQTWGSGGLPWPHHMEATNPCFDAVWVPDQTGHVYKVTLEAGSDYTARFVATPGTYGNQEETGAHVGLSGTTAANYLVVTGYGSVVQQPYAGTLTTPPLYMYLHDVLLEDVGGSTTYNRWTDPNVDGQSIGYPTIDQAGEISLTNSTSLRAGTYRLKVTSGNLGKVDEAFDGFRVLITVGDATIDRTLLAGYGGNNFTGTDEFEFSLDHDIDGEWLLTFDWTNPYEDVTRGTIRQLVIYGYQLRRLETNIYKVDVQVAGTEPDVERMAIFGETGDGGVTPGGWMAQYNDYGTVATWRHEGTVYPSNDTLTSRYPLANLLTGMTGDKREDVLFTVYGTRSWFVLPTASTTTLSGTSTIVT